MPASAPAWLERRQNSASSTTGPKAAPKPAQAKDTMLNTELLGSAAMKAAMMEITTTLPRASTISMRLLMRMCRKSRNRFWDTLEDAASSWESAVDMVAARMPARIMPPTSAASQPWLAIRSAMRMMIVSASEEVVKLSTAPAAEMALPTTPIITAAAMEMTTHTLATRRESFSFCASPMAMKRSSTWGMPK